MSDWYTDRNSQNTSEGAPSASETPTDTAANGQTPDATGTPAPTESSWSSNGAQNTPPTPPMPPTWHQPPQSQQPPHPVYQTQNGGWGTPQPPKKKKKLSGAAVLIALLAVMCVASLAASLVMIGTRAGNNSPQGGTSQSGGSQSGNDDKINENVPSIVTEEPAEEGLSSREIVSANLDSTVILRMYTSTSSGFNLFAQESTKNESSAGQATGIVWTADGYIITNAHCVYSEDLGAKFSRIEVELYDGTIFESAEIVGYDTTTDLAVIKVDATNLTPATFGNSDSLQLGDRVLVLGNNSGLGWSVTSGVVSGLARDVYEETNYAIKCLQVDAVINFGNSGGPLLNSSGQVVGINSAKIVAEGYEGLGFSIPFNEASEILQDLVRYGYVKGRIMLGIEGYTFNRYSGYEGFYISNISTQSSFSGTNVQAGDIITHVDGVRVKSYAEMREQLTAHQVGDQVTITLIRIDRNSRQVNTFDTTITLLESDGTV